MIMTDKAKPTITLAELYENQNQYIDALVIYKNLYKENPAEKLQSKVDELKDKIFNGNTLEYSEIINEIFTAEEKRFFHILPHEQYQAYAESQTELNNEETYPEELTEVKKEEVSHEEFAPEEIAPAENDKPEIAEKETIEIYDELEDDISLEIDEDVLDNLGENETLTEEKEEVIDTKKIEQSEDSEAEIEPIVKPQEKNNVLDLLTKLSKLKPDIVERVLKENVGADTSISEIKLSDLNFVVELLKVSINVEKE